MAETTLKDEWDQYANMAILPTATRMQYEWAQLSFYAGAHAAFSAMRAAGNTATEAEEQRFVRRMEAMADEAEAFCRAAVERMNAHA